MTRRSISSLIRRVSSRLLACRVVELPVDVPLARDVRARVAAAHRDDDVRPFRVCALELARHAVCELGHQRGDLRVHVRRRASCRPSAPRGGPLRAAVKSASAICERPAFWTHTKRTFAIAVDLPDAVRRARFTTLTPMLAAPLGSCDACPCPGSGYREAPPRVRGSDSAAGRAEVSPAGRVTRMPRCA